MPLQNVYVDVQIKDQLGVTEMTQVYLNPTQYAMETTFKFPKDPETIISNMVITIGDKTIIAVIMEKGKA